MVVAGGGGMQFERDADFDYEPGPEASIAARAAAAGVDPADYAYDLLCRDDGAGFAYLPILNYADGHLDFLDALQYSDDTLNSLSYGCSHFGPIFSPPSPTFILPPFFPPRSSVFLLFCNFFFLPFFSLFSSFLFS